MATTSASARHPALSTLEKTAVGVYVVILLALLYEQFGLFGGLFPPIGLNQMIVVIPALIGFAVRQRWLLVVTIVLLVLDLLSSVPYIVGDLSHPENTGPFVWTLIALPLYLAGIVLAAILFMRKLPSKG